MPFPSLDALSPSENRANAAETRQNLLCLQACACLGFGVGWGPDRSVSSHGFSREHGAVGQAWGVTRWDRSPFAAHARSGSISHSGKDSSVDNLWQFETHPPNATPYLDARCGQPGPLLWDGVQTHPMVPGSELNREENGPAGEEARRRHDKGTLALPGQPVAGRGTCPEQRVETAGSHQGGLHPSSATSPGGRKEGT